MRGHYEGKIRVGIIGCGSVSYPHLRSLVSTPETELVGFADVKGVGLSDKVGKQGDKECQK